MFLLEVTLILLLTGSFVGLIAGLFGVGGGIVMVPVLHFIFVWMNISSDLAMHMAVASSLGAMVFTSSSSTWAHQRRGTVIWPAFWCLTLGLLPGAWLGGIVADMMGGTMLRRFFGVFLLFVAGRMLFAHQVENAKTRLKTWLAAASGVIMGLISAMVGIGGGTLTVPFLMFSGVPARPAVGTGAACGVPIALAGSISFITVAWGKPDLPDYSLGYIYLPAVFALALTSVLFAPLGAKLMHQLPVQMLRRGFAVLLIAVSIKMLFLS